MYGTLCNGLTYLQLSYFPFGGYGVCCLKSEHTFCYMQHAVARQYLPTTGNLFLMRPVSAKQLGFPLDLNLRTA